MVEGLTCFRVDIRHIQLLTEGKKGAEMPLFFITSVTTSLLIPSFRT